MIRIAITPAAYAATAATLAFGTVAVEPDTGGSAPLNPPPSWPHKRPEDLKWRGTVGAAWRCGGMTEHERLRAALIALVAEDALIVEAQAEVERYLAKEFEAGGAC
jgi:hypothetical protein